MGIKQKIGFGIAGSLALVITPLAVAASNSQQNDGTVQMSANQTTTSSNEREALDDNPAATPATPADSSDNSGSASVSVTVNGESIDIPETESVHKTMESEDAHTIVDVDRSSSDSSRSSTGSTHTSTRVRINSRSTTTNKSNTSNGSSNASIKINSP